MSAPSKQEIRKVVLASLLGATIEWYDFFLYGVVAGIVFNKLFFPTTDPFIGTILAYSTFAIGYLARPLGGFVFGHFGDKLGRKSMLVLTMLIMGLATIGIGLVPTYAQIGIAAPIILQTLRLCQGLGLGGEWGGAVLMTYEYAQQARTRLLRQYSANGPCHGLVPLLRRGGAPVVGAHERAVHGMGLALRVSAQRGSGRRGPLYPYAYP